MRVVLFIDVKVALGFELNRKCNKNHVVFDASIWLCLLIVIRLRIFGNMKNMRGLNSDIISNLPDNILEKILMRLSILEVVSTSVLSKTWRYTWTRLSQLVFDDTFCKGVLRKEKNKLMMTIYHIMLFHRAPIVKFSLCFSGLESCPEIDPLILIVSNNEIQEFILLIWKGEPYKLPSSLFSCQQLKRLNLRCCMIKPPPAFKGFKKLLSLELREIVITGDVLSSLISSCRLLERLTVGCSTSLDCLEIDAPRLKFLCCEGHFSSICFKNTPKLFKVSIYLLVEMDVPVFKQARPSKLVTLLGSLPVIDFLRLDYFYIQYMAADGVPKRLPTTLKRLKTLRLTEICFGELEEILVMLCLIRSSPNLQKMTIRVHTNESVAIDSVLVLLEMQEWSDVTLNRLRQVEMRSLSGSRPELEFIKLLFAKSPVLETMLIEPNSAVVVDRGLGILKEASRFRRLSPRAEIKFENSDVDQV
ncbi:unnamed protein product [Camellia sinensis]